MADQEEDLTKLRAIFANPAIGDKDIAALLIEYSLESVTAHLIALMQPTARERFLVQVRETFPAPAPAPVKGA